MIVMWDKNLLGTYQLSLSASWLLLRAKTPCQTHTLHSSQQNYLASPSRHQGETRFEVKEVIWRRRRKKMLWRWSKRSLHSLTQNKIWRERDTNKRRQWRWLQNKIWCEGETNKGRLQRLAWNTVPSEGERRKERLQRDGDDSFGGIRHRGTTYLNLKPQKEAYGGFVWENRLYPEIPSGYPAKNRWQMVWGS